MSLVGAVFIPAAVRASRGIIPLYRSLSRKQKAASWYHTLGVGYLFTPDPSKLLYTSAPLKVDLFASPVLLPYPFQ